MSQAAERPFGQRIEIELGTDLTLDIQGLEGKMKSNLVGLVPSEFLIIAAPVGVTGIRQRLFEGNKMTLRYRQHGSVYGFKTQIITMITKPKPMLILALSAKNGQRYPEKVRTCLLLYQLYAGNR